VLPDDLCRGSRPDGVRPWYHDDPSVRMSGANVGEIATQPMTEEVWEPTCRRVHPARIDLENCGMHAHFSLKSDVLYQMLMSDEGFRDGLCRTLKNWGDRNDAPRKFFERVGGQTRWCKRIWCPDAQARARSKGSDGDRYAQINFCWRLHGTFEVRILNAFNNVEQSIAAIRVMINYIESYIATKLGATVTRNVERREQAVEVGRGAAVSGWALRVVENGRAGEVVHTCSSRPGAFSYGKRTLGIARPSSRTACAGRDGRLYILAESPVVRRQETVMQTIETVGITGFNLPAEVVVKEGESFGVAHRRAAVDISNLLPL